MKTPNRLRTLSISLSLFILAVGFSALGFIPFMSKPPGFAGSFFSVENAYAFVGSTFSILVGIAFLVAAITFKGLRPGSETLLAPIDANLI
jgi:hypothetical protein